MRKIARRLPAALITFVIGVAAANMGAALWPAGSDERAVLAVEREYVRAHVERDVAALERVLADDFTSFGGRVKKEHRLALLASPFYVVRSLKTEGVKVNVRGGEAWVTGKARLSASLRGRDYTTPRYEFTRRYERRAGGWQVVSCAFAPSW